MKKLLVVIMLLVVVRFLQSQHCTGQTATCTPAGLPVPGLSPSSEMLPAFVNGTSATAVLQFKNYDTARYMGSLVTVVRLRVDSINNLPSGLCWIMDHSNSIYSNQEDGCINIFGTTNSAAGQYKLKIKVGVDIDLPTNPFIPVDAANIGLNYYVRVVNSGNGLYPCLDTVGSPAFLAYGGVQPQCTTSVYSVNLGANQSVCNGASVTMNPAVTGGFSPFTYSWSATGNSLSCNNCQNPTATITQNSTFYVTVTDANNNTATDNIVYTVAGNNFQIVPNGATTFCQGGSVTLSAGSGYTNYHWNNNSVGSSLTVSQGGTYSVTVTSVAGCTFTDNEIVTVNTPSISNYQITANGPTSFCNGGSVILNAGGGFTSYHWSNNSSFQTITVFQTGNYTVTVSGVDGCTYTDGQSVNTNTSFSGQQVCIVSVDPASGKNVIVWEKSAGVAIDSFKVYRETNIANSYQLIRQQVFGNFSTYEDGQSNPQQQSNRYVMTSVDACGESSYSTAHQTVHLTSNVGINNEVNLIWNAYSGFSYPSFNIYRGTSSTNLQLLTSVSSATLSYTDLFPPAPPLYYQIEVVNPNGCVPTAKTESFSSSLSNIIQLNALSVEKSKPDIISVYSYYYEANCRNVLRINYNRQPSGTMRLYDISGRVVFELNEIYANEIYLPATLSMGIYLTEIITENFTQRSKIFIR